MKALEQVVTSLWPRLWNGEKVDIAVDAVEHPAHRPDLFGVPPAAWDMGQSCDWVWRLANASRVHVQCFDRGPMPSLRFHVDKYDPDAGLVSAIKHLLLETPAGPMLAMAGLALVAAKAGE